MEHAPIYKETLTQYLPHNPVIIEAGAHIGRDTLRMATLWPSATIYAFEPVPYLFRQLKERTASYPQVQCYNIALSNHTGTEQFFVSSGASTAVSSLYAPHEYTKDRPNVLFKEEQIETVSLDEWALKHKVTQVDFMWLDMQGAELKVIKAAPQVFATVQALVIEASLTERFKGMPLRDDIVSWLEQQKFTIVQQDKPKHNKVNLLAARPELL